MAPRTGHRSVSGIMVSIAAFQAVDLGLIPGRRRYFQIHYIFIACNFKQMMQKTDKGFATGHRSVGDIMVSIAAFQAVDPGSIPSRRRYL